MYQLSHTNNILKKIYTIWILPAIFHRNYIPVESIQQYSTEIYTIWVLPALFQWNYIPVEAYPQYSTENIHKLGCTSNIPLKLYTSSVLPTIFHRKYTLFEFCQQYSNKIIPVQAYPQYSTNESYRQYSNENIHHLNSASNIPLKYFFFYKLKYIHNLQKSNVRNV